MIIYSIVLIILNVGLFSFFISNSAKDGMATVALNLVLIFPLLGRIFGWW